MNVVFLDFEKLGLKLISYDKQVVNGFNHRLIYEDVNKKNREFVVYERNDGHMEVFYDSGK